MAEGDAVSAAVHPLPYLKYIGRSTAMSGPDVTRTMADTW
jgi:hypothetical protein